MWLNTAELVESKGRQLKRQRVAQKNRSAKGQYFTPLWLSKLLWGFIETFPVPLGESRKLSVMDTSVGTGHLLSYAQPEKHSLFGLDIDLNALEALKADAISGQFEACFLGGSIGDLEAENIDIALLNPAFNLSVTSRNLKPGLSTRMGTQGPHTSATIHEYALEQAVLTAQVVFAILPTSALGFVKAHQLFMSKLQFIASLPDELFKSEGASVSTVLCGFWSNDEGDDHPSSLKASCYAELNITEGCTIDVFDQLIIPSIKEQFSPPVFRLVEKSLIEQFYRELEETSDNRVELHHHNRDVVLKCFCSKTQEAVIKGLLGEPVPRDDESHRYPCGIEFCGQGRLNINLYLLQDDPWAALDDTLRIIQEHGGEPVLSPTFKNYFARCIRKHQLAVIPFRRAILKSSPGVATVVAKQFGMIRSSGVMCAYKTGEELTAKTVADGWLVSKGAHSQVIPQNDFFKRFEIVSQTDADAAWTLLFQGKAQHAQDSKAIQLKQRLTQVQQTLNDAELDRYGLHDYHIADAQEIMMHPTGAVIAHGMAVGKSWVAILQCLLRGEHNLIVIEARLMAEFVLQLHAAGIKDALTIQSEKDVLNLKKVNVISISTLKKVLPGRTSKTYAKLLRRRFHTVLVDEASCLAAETSEQSSALKSLAPKFFYPMDGTPIRSYVQSILPLVQYAHGNVAHQPYQLYGTYLEPRLLNNMAWAKRGIDAFMDDFACFDWVSKAYADNYVSGAKRQIPQIKNVDLFRKWISCLMLRRLRDEPECARFIGQIDMSNDQVIEVEWDPEHLKHYLMVSTQFVRWFQDQKQQAIEEGKPYNLRAVLARLEAVNQAANCPHVAGMYCTPYLGLTSKQKTILSRVQQIVSSGRKVVVYSAYPAVLMRLHEELGRMGIPALQYHGGISIKKRALLLDTEFRNGTTQVLLASMKTARRGLNIPQGDHVILADRDWSGAEERQLKERITRKGRVGAPSFEAYHLVGSIDNYRGQVSDFKNNASDSAIDYQDSKKTNDKFIHVDMMLEQFCLSAFNMSSASLLSDKSIIDAKIKMTA